MKTTSTTRDANTDKIKKSVSETGHVINNANLENLISFCHNYGSIYNPTKESLKIEQLQQLHQTASEKLAEVKTAKTTFDNATNSRRNAFSILKPFTTKILNAFIVSGVDTLAIANAKSINSKLQGTVKKKTTSIPENEGIISTTKNISTSQQSYDRMIDHLANLIQVLDQYSAYAPNEEELKVESLKAKLNDLNATNTSLINSYTQYSNAMLDRNKILYDTLSGLVQTSKEVKQYVKSIFGATSPQYKQISSLEFRVIK